MAQKEPQKEPQKSSPEAPSDDPLLQFFSYAHLPQDLQAFSKPFSNVANWLVKSVPANAERTNALRRLLEAKDSAVRARIFK